MFKPRPNQAEILQYTGGKMGVSAVPGSGKTATLSYLAARLVATVDLQDDQEVLIVTLVRSAVGNFAQSMARFLKDEFGLLPGLGYRVRTLHGLANDIVRERPGLVALADDFTVVDERVSDDILREAAEAWVNANPNAADAFLSDEYYANMKTRHEQWPDLVTRIASSTIKQAKDLQVPVGELGILLEKRGMPLSLIEMSYAIYEQYERSLRYRGAVDFQDLIRLALRVLKLDTGYLQRLQNRWPYILEDEAQDSSLLQQDILSTLVGEKGNWVRVGDPNQAIYETFTTANPQLLRDFLKRDDVQDKTLPNSGRSTQSIIRLANHLIDWSVDHPDPRMRDKQPLAPPHIQPTPEGDPQGNPPDNPGLVTLWGEGLSATNERELVINSLKRWLPENPNRTCAVLLPINVSGTKMVQALREANLPFIENLRSTTSTRAVIGALSHILEYLRDPRDSRALGNAYRVWQRDERGDEESERSIESVVREIGRLGYVEDFIWPRVNDWLDEKTGDNEELRLKLETFRTLVRRWQGAADLPVDQLILTITGDIFHLDTEIATAYSAALYLRRFAEIETRARLPEFAAELQAIARGQRKFTGASDEDDAFDPDKHGGKVTVTTLHKAKGLEWDRVYVMSVSNYDFPSADPYDTYQSEKWFIRDKLNLEAEALEQLRCLVEDDQYSEGRATEAARIEYAAERLRLLYVGITRARRELIITWNTGRKGENVEARPLAALRGWWEQQQVRS